MAKPIDIQLPRGVRIPILHEDRSVFAIDKPSGWIVAPEDWAGRQQNIHRALMTSVQHGDYWAKSRQIRFLRFIHRLDADTSGVLLLVKNKGAIPIYSRLFENRQVEKVYLAVVSGIPRQKEWTCNGKLAPDPFQKNAMWVDDKDGQPAETHFRVLESRDRTSLVEARPVTGRTHQIRVHLQTSGHPILGDALYAGGVSQKKKDKPMLALRAVELSYPDPFTRKRVTIKAPSGDFFKKLSNAQKKHSWNTGARN